MAVMLCVVPTVPVCALPTVQGSVPSNTNIGWLHDTFTCPHRRTSRHMSIGPSSGAPQPCWRRAGCSACPGYCGKTRVHADLHDLLVHLQGLQVHIAPYAACEGLFRGAAAALPPGGPLCLYGPFLRGQGDAPSNIAFDRMLRRHDPAWGVRELARVRATAGECGLDMQEAVDMPSNNLLLVFKQRTADA